jgi:peptidoglycan hydrolase-like amidase
MAADGMSFQEILAHYFPGVTLASGAGTASVPQAHFGPPPSIRDVGQ